jgi:hypothetical protein
VNLRQAPFSVEINPRELCTSNCIYSVLDSSVSTLNRVNFTRTETCGASKIVFTQVQVVNIH